MLRFILGRSGTGKTREMYRQIKEKIKNGCDRLIVLIPDQISLETEKEMLSLLGAPDKQKVNVFGFNKLCRFVYKLLRLLRVNSAFFRFSCDIDLHQHRHFFTCRHRSFGYCATPAYTAWLVGFVGGSLAL